MITIDTIILPKGITIKGDDKASKGGI